MEDRFSAKKFFFRELHLKPAHAALSRKAMTNEDEEERGYGLRHELGRWFNGQRNQGQGALTRNVIWGRLYGPSPYSELENRTCRLQRRHDDIHYHETQKHSKKDQDWLNC